MADFDHHHLHKDAHKLFEPLPNIQAKAHVKSIEDYQKLYDSAVEDPAGFWAKILKEFNFFFKTPPDPNKFLSYNFDVRNGPIFIKWMEGAETNVCYNVLDRNIEQGLGDRIAFYWEGNDPDDSCEITYNELRKQVCKFANVLKTKGVKRGDRVAIYMPMIVELVVAMLACARIGAVHSIVFGGFSASSLSERILDAKCSILVTADGVWRGKKLIELKQICDDALKICIEAGHKVNCNIVVRHLTSEHAHTSADDPIGKRPYYNAFKLNWDASMDQWWHELMSDASDVCEPVWLGAEEPLFMLYTSGSTGKPKGVLHTQIGYLLFAATTFKYNFDFHDDDIYYCTADIGWITGHSYVVYGPMANGASSVMFEGIPTYPDAGRFWQICDKYQVTKFYTAPTAIRLLMKYGESFVERYSRSSLQLLGTVGEPINPEAWLWYYNVVGEGRCAVVDTYWQTETGGHVISPLPGATKTKPGSATFPFFGILPSILDESGNEVTGEGEGYLVISKPWPGIMRTVYGDHERFETTYFKKFPGYYVTGDGARRDKDGYIWITGRIDDMFNVSGHLLSTAEIESALIEHADVVETAVVSHPHPVKGECTYCFITMKDGCTFNEKLVGELKDIVRRKIGPFATPDFLQFAPALPKTRSGKIMRRILRKVAVNDRSLGDITTLADDSVVEILFQLRPDNA